MTFPIPTEFLPPKFKLLSIQISGAKKEIYILVKLCFEKMCDCKNPEIKLSAEIQNRNGKMEIIRKVKNSS